MLNHLYSFQFFAVSFSFHNLISNDTTETMTFDPVTSLVPLVIQTKSAAPVTMSLISICRNSIFNFLDVTLFSFGLSSQLLSSTVYIVVNVQCH